MDMKNMDMKNMDMQDENESEETCVDKAQELVDDLASKGTYSPEVTKMADELLAKIQKEEGSDNYDDMSADEMGKNLKHKGIIVSISKS